MDRTIFPYSFRITHHDRRSEERAIPEERTIPAGVDDAYTFQIEASNLNLDAYYTHMTRRTLQSFANNARAGVQFLDSHNNRNLGYGRTYGGQVRVDRERPIMNTAPDGAELAFTPPTQYAYALLDVYTVPGIRFGGGLTYASTDDFIRAVDSGLAADVSVGFYGGAWRCDVCNNDYRNYQLCQHFAGNVYELNTNGATRRVLATVAVDGAELAEVSAVYDGATPNASILKARAMAEDGRLDVESKRFIEVRYQVDLPTGRIFPVATLPNSGRQQADGGNMEFEEIVNQTRDILAETAAPEGGIPDQVRWLIAENARLQPLADDGRAYRADLVANALAEGVRAYGETFSQETYQGLMERASLDAIKRMTADWKAVGDKRFVGGRSIEDEQPEKQEQPRRVVPTAAHKV